MSPQKGGSLPHTSQTDMGGLGLQPVSPPKPALPRSSALGAGHSRAEQQGGDWLTATSFACGMGAAKAVPGTSGTTTYFQGRKIMHRERTKIKSPWKRKTFISSLSVLRPLESCPAVKRENHPYTEHNFIAHFCFWWKLIHVGFFLHQLLCLCPSNGKVPFNQMKYCYGSLQFLSSSRGGQDCEFICLWLLGFFYASHARMSNAAPWPQSVTALTGSAGSFLGQGTDPSPSLTQAVGAWFRRRRWTLPPSPLYLGFIGGMVLAHVLDSS